MKLNKAQAKEINSLRKVAKKRAIRIWIISVFITVAIILIQAIIGKWLISFIGIDIDLFTAIIATIIANFAGGFLKLERYVNKKRKSK